MTNEQNKKNKQKEKVEEMGTRKQAEQTGPSGDNPRHTGEARATAENEGDLDFQREFRESFNKAMFYGKMAETALAYLDDVNPSKTILPEIQNLDDSTQKDIRDALAGDMTQWLEMWRKVLNEGKSMPVDIIGMASDLARKDRKRVQEE